MSLTGRHMFEGVAIHQWLLWGTLHLLSADVALTSETRRPCPQPCRCQPVLLEANCSDGQLTTLPIGLPRDTTVLNLTRNIIKTLVQQQFQSLTQLLHLDLSENIISVIELEAFVGLQSLVTLCLARNHLKIIPVGAFTGLPNLTSLDISSNEILVFLDFTFHDLTALQLIKAAGNDLVFISPRAFTGVASLQELHLDGGNLSAVPTEALAQLGGLRSLHIHELSLTALPNYAFSPLENLKELFISHCYWLENLSANSLFGLNLTSLTIRHAKLRAIPHITLHHLVYLVYLDLSFNPISCIHGNLLGALVRLQELHLVGGSLTCIDNGAFKGLSNLRLVNVSKNVLTTLEVGVFQSVGTLKSLGLDNNPLACDCRLLWVVQRQPYLDFGGIPPTCTTSVQMQGWSFVDNIEAEVHGLFTCRRPHILTSKPQRVTVDQGHTVEFYCNAEGDPPPSIIWLDPQQKPLSPNGRMRALANGSLEVRYAQPQDSGTYLCVASNAAGNESMPVSLHVRAFPSSSKHPFHLKEWLSFPSVSPGVNGTQTLPLDVKTLLIAAAIGFLSFSSSVGVCFIVMFFWSKSKGQIKHTVTISYVPRSAVSSNKRETPTFMDTSRVTMKLI